MAKLSTRHLSTSSIRQGIKEQIEVIIQEIVEIKSNDQINSDSLEIFEERTKELEKEIHSPELTSLLKRAGSLKKILDNPSLIKEELDLIQNDLKQLKDSTFTLADNLPQFSIKNFIGREQELNKINEYIKGGKYVAIIAFGGTGKSSVALEYAHKQKEQGTTVRWIVSDSKERAGNDYLNLAQELSIYLESKDKDIDRIIPLVNNKLKTLKADLLFIFDNVEHYEDIEDYLLNLPNQVKVIITTRDHNLSENNQKMKVIKLEPFGVDEAKIYIKQTLGNRVGVKEEKLDKLIGKLIEKTAGTEYQETGVSPLALSHIIAIFNKKKLLTEEILTKYIEEYADSSPTDNLLGLLTSNKNTLAWQVLQYAARLDPDYINIEIFKALLKLKETALEESISILESLSLAIVVNGEEGFGLKIHRLVQEEVKKYSKSHSDTAIQDIESRLIIALDNLMPLLDSNDEQKLELAKAFYNHGIKMVENFKEQNIEHFTSLQNKLNAYEYFRDIHSARYLGFAEFQISPDHPDFIMTQEDYMHATLRKQPRLVQMLFKKKKFIDPTKKLELTHTEQVQIERTPETKKLETLNQEPEIIIEDPLLNSDVCQSRCQCTILKIYSIKYNNPILNYLNLMQQFANKYGPNELYNLVNFGRQFASIEDKGALEEICNSPEALNNITLLMGLDA